MGQWGVCGTGNGPMGIWSFGYIGSFLFIITSLFLHAHCPTHPLSHRPSTKYTLAHMPIASYANMPRYLICPLPHFPITSYAYIPIPYKFIATYTHCPIRYSPTPGLALVNDQNKCFVIEVCLRNQAEFTFSNVRFVTCAVHSRYSESRSRNSLYTLQYISVSIFSL